MVSEGFVSVLDFFELTQLPFEANPNRPLVLATGPLRRAVAWIRTEIQFGTPRLALTGSDGIGKTSVALALHNQLEDRVACVFDVSQPWNEIEVSIARQLSLETDSLSRDALRRDRPGPGHRVVVIDDAERLTDETLSCLQEVLGFGDREGSPLVRCVAIGNPDRGRLGGPTASWLEEIQPRTEIDAMLTRELVRYVEARLVNAGWRGADLFSREAMGAIHRLSHGLPMVANLICEGALVVAASCECRLIDADMIEEVWDEMFPAKGAAAAQGPLGAEHDDLPAYRTAAAQSSRDGAEEEAALLPARREPGKPAAAHPRGPNSPTPSLAELAKLRMPPEPAPPHREPAQDTQSQGAPEPVGEGGPAPRESVAAQATQVRRHGVAAILGRVGRNKGALATVLAPVAAVIVLVIVIASPRQKQPAPEPPTLESLQPTLESLLPSLERPTGELETAAHTPPEAFLAESEPLESEPLEWVEVAGPWPPALEPDLEQVAAPRQPPAAQAAPAPVSQSAPGASIEDLWPDDLELTLDTERGPAAAPGPALSLPEPEITPSLGAP